MSDELHLWSGLYATDSLEGDELSAFEEHLALCPECQAEVAGFRETITQLAAPVAAVAPTDARARIMAQVAATRQASPLIPQAGRDDVADGDAVPPQIIDLASRRRRPWIGLGVAAAFVALAAAASVAIGTLNHRATQAEQIAAIVAQPDARTIDLKADGRSGAKIVWSPAKAEAVLLADNMPAVETGKTYELWVVRDGTPHKVTLFRPDDKGSLRDRFAAQMTDRDVVGVTVEPAGGSERPTSPMIMSSSA